MNTLLFPIRRAGALILLAGMLAACGSDGPAPYTAPKSPELTGTATYDAPVVANGVSVKGTQGLTRTNSNSSGTNQFAVSLQDSAGPYIMRWIGGDASGNQVQLYSVATQAGVANVTALTTLLVAQLLGQQPSAAYSGFTATSGHSELVTDANIKLAQTKVTDYLQNTLKVSVKSGTQSFVTAPFTAQAGDPIFDTITSLEAQLSTQGTTLDAVATTLANAAKLCINEKIEITLGGGSIDFCIASKSATPEDDDNTILDYVFTDPQQDALTLNIQGDSVLGMQYKTADGTTFTCSAAACNAVTLGAIQSDLTRTLTFTGTQLNGTSGSAVLNGTLLGPVPGVALPVLPCSDNRFFVIFADRTVSAQCVDTLDPLQLGGTINSSRGEFPSRAVFDFVNSSNTDPANATVEVTLDANDSVISVEYYKYNSTTGELSDAYYCELTCNGVTLGPITINTDLGPDVPVSIRNITLDNATLAGVNLDGTPTNTTATLKGSFTMVYYVDPYNPFLFPTLADCADGSVSISIGEDSGSFNYCSSPSNQYAMTNPLSVGLFDDNYFTPLNVTTANGVVTSVVFQSSVNQNFSCSTDCVGVALSTDAHSNVSLTFTNTVLHENQQTPLPTGPRAVTLNSATIVIPSTAQAVGTSVQKRQPKTVAGAKAGHLPSLH